MLFSFVLGRLPADETSRKSDAVNEEHLLWTAFFWQRRGAVDHSCLRIGGPVYSRSLRTWGWVRPRVVSFCKAHQSCLIIFQGPPSSRWTPYESSEFLAVLRDYVGLQAFRRDL